MCRYLMGEEKLNWKKKYWLIIEDEFTSMKLSYFTSRKPEAGDKVVDFIFFGKRKDPNFGKYL